jgi:dTDP-glucose 4,6-dehydratase|tara:strand:- start:305 stop:706 length:402 start_codon:yes stop_codon:yes gene_type:complete
MNEVKLGDVRPTRDFSFVQDTVRGFIAALMKDESVGEVINLGNNFEISIGRLVDLIAEQMGAEIVITADESRIRPMNSEVERLWADNSKANRLLDWKPEFSGLHGLRQGLKVTAEWFRCSKNLGAYKPEVYNV